MENKIIKTIINGVVTEYFTEEELELMERDKIPKIDLFMEKTENEILDQAEFLIENDFRLSNIEMGV